MTSVFFTLITSALLLLSSPAPASAQIDIPGRFFQNHPRARVIGTSPGSLISALLPNVMVFAGVVFLAIIIIYGFTFITHSGQNLSPAEISKNRNIFTAGLVGFLLVVSSYFILNIMGIITGIPFINLASIPF